MNSFDNIEFYKRREKQTIVDWLHAWMNADERHFLGGHYVNIPRYQQLVDLYEVIMVDPHLTACINNRKNKVLGEIFFIKNKDGVVDEQKTKFFKRSWFNEFINHVLDAKYFPHSLIELTDIENNKIKLIERRNTVISEKYNLVLTRANDINSGKPFNTSQLRDFYIPIKFSSHGLLLNATPMILSKRNSFTSWQKASEKYGVPLAVYKIDDIENVEKLRKVELGLQKMQKSNQVILPPSDDIRFEKATERDAYQIFKISIDSCNEEVSKLILGQTSSTDSGGQNNVASLQKSTLDEIIEADKSDLENVVNQELIPRLVKLGFYFSEGDYLEFQAQVQKPTFVEQGNLTLGLLNYYDIEPETIKNLFNIDVKKKLVDPQG